jgi:hypothetical protein
LVLDQDHPFLSVGIVNYNQDGSGPLEYWTGLTWDLSSFLPSTDDDSTILSTKQGEMAVYKIQYDDDDDENNNNNNRTRCKNASAVTLVRVPLDNFTTDDFPTVSCEAYHWLDRQIENGKRKIEIGKQGITNGKRTTTIVAAVLGSGLAMAILAIIALGLVIVRQQSQKPSSV